MGTKNNPGAFDCYAAALPDEPLFTVLGRDPTAAFFVRLWVYLRGRLDAVGLVTTDVVKLNEAGSTARALSTWCTENYDKMPALELVARLEMHVRRVIDDWPWSPPLEVSVIVKLQENVKLLQAAALRMLEAPIAGPAAFGSEYLACVEGLRNALQATGDGPTESVR